jgi:hypothetical protein
MPESMILIEVRTIEQANEEYRSSGSERSGAGFF